MALGRRRLCATDDVLHVTEQTRHAPRFHRPGPGRLGGLGGRSPCRAAHRPATGRWRDHGRTDGHRGLGQRAHSHPGRDPPCPRRSRRRRVRSAGGCGGALSGEWGPTRPRPAPWHRQQAAGAPLAGRRYRPSLVGHRRCVRLRICTADVALVESPVLQIEDVGGCW